MATVPFPGVWSPNTQLTGNSIFAIDANGTVWLVGNSTANGSAIFSSPAGATAFTQIIEIPNDQSADLAFDPAMTIDADGAIHIVGQIRANGIVSLQKYTYTPSTNTLAGPFLLNTNGYVGADYDIVALANGNTYVASCLLTASTETISGMEVDSTGDVLSSDIFITQPLNVGNRYGSVSLWTPDGVAVEVYLCFEPKAFAFADTVVSIALAVRASAGNVTAPTVLSTIAARYVAGRLTVLGNLAERYVAQCYYTQVGGQLISNLLVGHLALGTTAWDFKALTGAVQSSYLEPTLSLSSAGLVLALIGGDANNFAKGGPVMLFDLNPLGWVLTPRTDFPYPAFATWLRGAKSALPTTMPWGFLAQDSATGVARFYTGYNAPPTADIEPMSETAQRNVTYTFDASGSTDINLDNLTFTWTINDPTGKAVFEADGDTATVMLPSSIGPAAETVTVTVAVMDVTAAGAPLHSIPSTASATLTYPFISPPQITSPGIIQAARNSQVRIAPVITLSPFVSATYAWTQTGGTSIEFLSSANLSSLLIETNGAATAGEALLFKLVVNDGINAPVSSTLQVMVAARQPSGESELLARAVFNGNISQRNTVQTWSAPVTTTEVTEFTSTKRAPLIPSVVSGVMVADQAGSYILIGPAAVLVQRKGTHYHALTVNPADTILDAEHSFLDETVLLTSSGLLLQIFPNATATDTDNAAATIDLSTIVTSPFTKLSATPPFDGERVLFLTGVAGVLLLQVDGDFNPTGSLFLSSNGEHLYGASDVQWVRETGVEDLHTGTLLIGTVDNMGHTFETEFQLANRSVIGVWDASQLRNQTVTTGELLFEDVDSYSGLPMPPVLTNVIRGANGLQLTWTQTRQDLVSGYSVLMTTNGFTSDMADIGSGEITTINLALPTGATYAFQIVAHSLDGDSGESNTITVTI